MTNLEYIEQAQAVVWCQDWPKDLKGYVVRLVDFTGERSFQAMASGRGYQDLTHWRIVHDRLAWIIRQRGGRVSRSRLNLEDYHHFRSKHRFLDTRRVRDLFMRNYVLMPAATRRS